MSDILEKNYSLRPKRAVKGKYREMAGIAQNDSAKNKKCSNNDELELQNEEKKCNVYLLPVVVSGSGENEVIATIEINDPDNVIIPELSINMPVKRECLSDEESTEITLRDIPVRIDNPSQHIEEILKKNDELIENIPEGPKFKKRKMNYKESKQYVNTSTRQTMEANKQVTKLKSTPVLKTLNLTMKSIQEKICRPLTENEIPQLEELLEDGDLKSIVDMLFSSDADNRVRKCLVCHNLIEGSDSEYASHYATIHQSEPSFACEFCNQITNSEKLYQTHIQSHFKTKRRVCKSDIDKSESSEDVSDQKDTSSNEPFVCDICGKTLKHQKSLYSHRRTHTDSKAVCHICGTTLKSSRYLHHHLLLHKDIDKPHKCDKCSKAFHSSSALKVHHYYNHEEHPGRFQCTICGKIFKAKQGLQFHMDSHSSELRYECSLCHKRFRGFKTCRVHELRHREANEPNKYSCPICGKFFKTRQTLKNHEDVHASFNRYQCSICEKRFKLKKSCLAHIRVHHNKEREENNETVVGNDEGQIAVQSLLADGEEYVVTIEDGGEVQLEGVEDRHIEFIVPDADVECEVADFS